MPHGGTVLEVGDKMLLLADEESRDKVLDIVSSSSSEELAPISDTW